MELITKALEKTNTAAAQASAVMNNPLAVSAHLFCSIPFASRIAVHLLTPHIQRTGRHWKETGGIGRRRQLFSTVTQKLYVPLEAAGMRKSCAPGSKAGGDSACNSYK